MAMPTVIGQAPNPEPPPGAATPGPGYTAPTVRRMSQSQETRRQLRRSARPSRVTSLRPMDLAKGRVPSEREIRRSGQLGDPLAPTASADPTSIRDAKKRRRAERDNRTFAEAMESWNRHRYDEAAALFDEHIAAFPASPWRCEAELHLGCRAQQLGRWAEAEKHFQTVLSTAPKGSDMWRKGLLRHGVFLTARGRLDEATETFQKMLHDNGGEQNWERRTYGHSWLKRLSMMNKQEVALRDCGEKALLKLASLLPSTSPKVAESIATEAARRRNQDASSLQRGFSLADIRAMGRNSGFPTSLVLFTKPGDAATQLPTPFLAHYSDEHYVVVESQLENGAFRVHDTRLGHSVEMPEGRFKDQWSGYALLPTPQAEDLLASGAVQPVGDSEAAELRGGCCGVPPPPAPIGFPEAEESITQPPDNCRCPPCGLPVWDVNIMSMNVSFTDIPLWWDAPAGPSVFFQLTYNSQDAIIRPRPFGRKWVFNYTGYIMEDAAGTVDVVGHTGTIEKYLPSGFSWFISPPGVEKTLVKIDPAGYEYILYEKGGAKVYYGVPDAMPGAAVSLIKKVVDRFGVEMIFTHNEEGALVEVTHSLLPGRKWELFYDEHGLVREIHDPFDRIAYFSYEPVPNAPGEFDLVAQTDMGGVSYGYRYDTHGYPTKLIKPSGDVSFMVEPADGIEVSEEGEQIWPPTGTPMWESYRVSVTDALGLKETYFYSGYFGDAWYDPKSDDLPTPDVATPKLVYRFQTLGSYTPSERGVIREIQDYAGNIATRSNFNEDRLPQRVTEPGNTNAHQFTYNSQGQIRTHTDPRGNITTREYEPNGLDLNLVKDARDVTILDIEYHPDNSRLPHHVTDALGRTTTTTWTTLGQPLTSLNPRNELTEFRYYPVGHASAHRLHEAELFPQKALNTL